MGLHWITFAKIAGPLVPRIRQEMLDWAPKPADGNEPKSANGSVFLVTEPASIERMHTLAHMLQVHAIAPPIVHYERLIDPWTVAPILWVYERLRGLDANLRVARSDALGYLIAQPRDWVAFMERLDTLRTKIYSGDGFSVEDRRLFAHIVECAASWEALLAASGVERAVLVLGEGVGGSWLDEEVKAAVTELPTWYDG